MRPVGLGAVLGLLCCAALVSIATAEAVDVPASIVVETWEIPNPPVDPNRCVTVFFVQFADVPDAGVYSVVIFNQVLQQNQTFTAGPAPSFPDDEYTITSGQGSITFVAPAGTHRIAVGEGSSGQGCQTTPLFDLVSATTEVEAEKVLLMGTVTHAQCSRRQCRQDPLAGVTIAAAGTESGSAQTGSDGSYALELKKGDYVVTPSRDGFEFSPEQRTVALTQDTGGVDFQACGREAGGEIRTLAPKGDKPCFVVLRGQIQSAIDGAPFARPHRAGISGGPLTFVHAVDKAGTMVADAHVEHPDGRFELKVPKGSYVLRMVFPSDLEPVTMLPRGGPKVVARRDRDDVVIRIRPTLVRLYSNPGNTGYTGDYLLELLDTRPFDGGPDVNGVVILGHARPGPDKLIPTCTDAVATRFPSPSGSLLQLFRVPVQNVVPGEPDHDLPLCPGEYKGEVAVGGQTLAKFVVRLTGGFQTDIPFTELRYFGRFRR